MTKFRISVWLFQTRYMSFLSTAHPTYFQPPIVFPLSEHLPRLWILSTANAAVSIISRISFPVCLPLPFSAQLPLFPQLNHLCSRKSWISEILAIPFSPPTPSSPFFNWPRPGPHHQMSEFTNRITASLNVWGILGIWVSPLLIIKNKYYCYFKI